LLEICLQSTDYRLKSIIGTSLYKAEVILLTLVIFLHVKNAGFCFNTTSELNIHGVAFFLWWCDLNFFFYFSHMYLLNTYVFIKYNVSKLYLYLKTKHDLYFTYSFSSFTKQLLLEMIEKFSVPNMSINWQYSVKIWWCQ